MEKTTNGHGTLLRKTLLSSPSRAVIGRWSRDGRGGIPPQTGQRKPAYDAGLMNKENAG